MPVRNLLIFAGGVAVFLIVIWLAQSNRPAAPRAAVPLGPAVTIPAPLGLPAVPIPPDNPPTAETLSLGRRLYYDTRLSVDNTVACATCHHPDHGFTDGKPFSEGVRGQKGGRNAPTVFNAAYNPLQFWDGRAPSLEKQAEGPVQNPVEMAHTLPAVESRLAADPSYRAAFEKAFGPGGITYAMVEKAIASFERTVLSGNSPFDRYFYGGDQTALSEAARRGLAIFRDPKKGNCTACHTIEEKQALFTDNKFHNLGIGADPQGNLKDLGRYNETQKEADKGAFKTPSLRSIARTAPYMHDGSLPNLQSAIDFYVAGGNTNPYLDKEMKPLDFLSFQERADLLAFLESLTGEMPPNVGPPQ